MSFSSQVRRRRCAAGTACRRWPTRVAPGRAHRHQQVSDRDAATGVELVEGADRGEPAVHAGCRAVVLDRRQHRHGHRPAPSRRRKPQRMPGTGPESCISEGLTLGPLYCCVGTGACAGRRALQPVATPPPHPRTTGTIRAHRMQSERGKPGRPTPFGGARLSMSPGNKTHSRSVFRNGCFRRGGAEALQGAHPMTPFRLASPMERSTARSLAHMNDQIFQDG